MYMNQQSIKRIIPAAVILFGVLLATLFFTATMQSHPVVSAAPMMQALPSVSFNASNTNVNEGAGTVTIDVIISAVPAATAPVTVTYTTLNGTATAGAGSDYLTSSGIITFTSTTGTSKSFTVTINDDTVSENNEQFNVVLQSPENANLGAPSTATVTIIDNDPTPTPTSGAVIFSDAQEPNDIFNDATTVIPEGGKLCRLTLWPIGDLDHFRFAGKAGARYDVRTTDLSAGLDTVMTVYNTSLNAIGTNDDFAPPNKASQVSFTASADGFYYVRISNRSPTDPTNLTYCIEVDELTPEPTNTPPAAFPTDADRCEYNSTVESACLLVADGTTETFNFVPTLGSSQDTDIYRIFVKPGILYTCETFIPAGSPADTNIILKNNSGNDFVPNIGNDDKSFGDFGSRVSYLSTYTGHLYVVVGPVDVPPLAVADLYEYELSCVGDISTPTPTPFPTSPPSSGGGPGSGGSFPPAATPTPFAFPTPLPTPTPIDFSFLTPMAPTPPAIQIQPLPTPTAVSGQSQDLAVTVTLFYDANENFTPELTEGIMDAAIALYDNSTGQLIAIGSTNEAGMTQFSNINAVGAVRVSVPFLNYSQIVVGNSSDILIRVAPQPLPGGIP